jgi:hypothetical protein
VAVAGPSLLALLACAVCFLAGWRGDDWAAQVYRADEVARWGFMLWDPGWYGGVYPLNYSLVYPLMAAYLGLWLVAAASAVGATYCFDRLVTRELGRRPAGSWYFAISTVVEVAIGQLPTLAGEAMALGSVLCLAGYRSATTPDLTGGSAQLSSDPRRWCPQWARVLAGFALAVMAALTSPVVGAFLALTFVAWGLAEVGRSGGKSLGVFLIASVVTIVSTAALPLIFPGAGSFPFGFADFLVVLAICALLASPLLQASRPVRLAALIYGAASTILFFFPTQMGDNDIRFAAYIGVPLIICYLPRLVESLEGLDVQRVVRVVPVPQIAGRSGHTGASARPIGHTKAVVLAFALTAGLLLWHWSPVAEALGGPANGPSSTPSFYKPLINELVLLTKGRPVRVEVPPTDHHWESAYVAPAFPLARGWERQLDIAYNPLFYAPGPLSPAAYRNWLIENGVSFVALPNAPLDYAAVAETTLLRSGKAQGLRPVWHSDSWQLWRVLGSRGLANGPATVISLSPQSVTAKFYRSGATVIKVRWSAYWSLMYPTSRHACVRPAPGGWTELSSTTAGTVDVGLSVVEANRGTCSAAGGVRS